MSDIISIEGIGSNLFTGNEPIEQSMGQGWAPELVKKMELYKDYPQYMGSYDQFFYRISATLIFGAIPEDQGTLEQINLALKYTGPTLPDNLTDTLQQVFFVSNSNLNKRDCNTKIFEKTFLLTDEQETGFEPEEFLSTTNKEKFESQTEKLETFKTRLSEQLKGLDSLYKKVEVLPIDMPAPMMIQVLIDSPEYSLLSKEQKYNFKKGICSLVDKRENLSVFLETNEELDAKGTIAKLRDIDSTHFKGSIEMERNDYILNLYVENKEDYDYIKTKGLQQESSSGGFQTELYEGFPLVVTFIGDQSKESIEEFDIHEKRHARDRMIMKKEETRAFEGIKLEFLAYLEDGSSWKNILYYLTRDDGYTYGLEGEAWKQHKEYVRSLVDILKDCDCKNHLDTLAVLPLAKWPFAARYLIPKIPEPIVETQEPQRSEPIVEKQELQKVEEKATEKKSSGFIHLVSKFFRSL